MSLLRFLGRKDGLPDPTGVLSTIVPSAAIAQDRLPDPTGVLSTIVPSAAIAQANQEIQNPISGDKQKRGPYKKYSVGLHPEIGKYATTNTAGSSVDVLNRGCHHCLHV